jgi:hypothetical protein
MKKLYAVLCLTQAEYLGKLPPSANAAAYGECVHRTLDSVASRGAGTGIADYCSL